jgi:hypothetical protein
MIAGLPAIDVFMLGDDLVCSIQADVKRGIPDRKLRFCLHGRLMKVWSGPFVRTAPSVSFGTLGRRCEGFQNLGGGLLDKSQ